MTTLSNMFLWQMTFPSGTSDKGYQTPPCASFGLLTHQLTDLTAPQSTCFRKQLLDGSCAFEMNTESGGLMTLWPDGFILVNPALMTVKVWKAHPNSLAEEKWSVHEHSCSGPFSILALHEKVADIPSGENLSFFLLPEANLLGPWTHRGSPKCLMFHLNWMVHLNWNTMASTGMLHLFKLSTSYAELKMDVVALLSGQNSRSYIWPVFPLWTLL